MDIKIIKCDGPQPDHLEQFKQYASVPDDSRDGVLMKMLKRAMLEVQEFSDIAMLPCRIEMTLTDVRPGDFVKLYQGGKTVVSVTDATDGEQEVGYEQMLNGIFFRTCHQAVTVVYENQVVIPEAEKLQPLCWELATAIYDGEDAKVQGSILKKTYGLL